jgi:CBS domain containing-hemolysin-like protein
MARAGRLLQVGDTVEFEGKRFVVERLDQRRIRRIRLTLPSDKIGISASLVLPLLGASLLVL